MPEPGAKPFGQQSNPVCIKRLLCLLLLGSQFIGKVETLLSKSPGQCVCPVLGLTAGVFHQHCPGASTWPANALQYYVKDRGFDSVLTRQKHIKSHKHNAGIDRSQTGLWNGKL